MRGRHRSALVIAALLLTACGRQSPAPETAETDVGETMQETQQAELAKQCITTALNNTIYKQQNDVDLETALLAQNLGQCPNDFIQSYVELRNAVKDYFAVGREILTHQNIQKTANEGDWWNFGCSILAGKQCSEWPSEVWASQSAEIRARFEAAKAALERAKRENESVIARYGLYRRTVDPAAATATDYGQGNVM